MRRRTYNVILVGVEPEQAAQKGGLRATWRGWSFRRRLIAVAFVIEYWAAIQFVVAPLLSR